MAERKTAHFPDFHLPHPDLKILRNSRLLLSVLGLGGLTGTFIGIKHIQDELNKPPAPRSQTIDTPPSFAPAVVPIDTVTSTPLKPTVESSPTIQSTEISIDKTGSLFSSPDSRATFQPYDPAFKVTKDTIIGQFGDFIIVRGDNNNELFLPKQSAQNLPAGLKELTPDQISQWPTVADLNLKSKDAQNLTVSDVFKVNVNLKEKEGLTLTDTNGNILLIQVDSGSQLSFQFKKGPNVMTANAGKYTEGTLRVDLTEQKATFFDASGKAVVSNVPMMTPIIPGSLFTDRKILSAKLNASGDSNAQALVTPDGRYIDPKTRIPTATALLPAPEDIRVPAPAPASATVPARPAAATPTQKPAEATATAVPTAEKPTPRTEIGELERDGFTLITEEGSKYEIVVSPNTIGVPPGQNPTEANLQFIKEGFEKFRNAPDGGKGRTLKIILHSDTTPLDGYKLMRGNFYRKGELIGNTIVVHVVPAENLNLQNDAVWLLQWINDPLRHFLEGRHNFLITGVPESGPVRQDLNAMQSPTKVGVRKRNYLSEAEPTSKITFINRDLSKPDLFGGIQKDGIKYLVVKQDGQAA